MIARDWASPSLQETLEDKLTVQKTVAKCLFYMMFGIWVDEDEAETLAAWRTLARFFVLPRLIQRFAFNLGINKVKKLRADTVRLVERHNLYDVFMKMNGSLDAKYR